MAFSISGTKKSDPGSAFKRDPRKAHKFFEHAQTVADARNYDYAVDCYINGLRHDPDNLAMHEALRDVAMRRKVSGGKPPSLKDKLMPSSGSSLEKMLHDEKLLSQEPQNLKLMLSLMQHAADAHEEIEEIELGDFVYWIGNLVLEHNTKQDKRVFLKARDSFAKVGAFDKAVYACQRALQQDPGNSQLLQDLKNLEAERTMMQGGYDEEGEGEGAAEGEQAAEGGEGKAERPRGGNFRRSIRDSDRQQDLDQEGRLAAGASAIERGIERARREYEDDPQDMDKLSKLVDALLRKADAESEKQALELLEKAHEQTGEYRYRVKQGDLRMKQYAKLVKHLRAKLAEKPDDDELKSKLESAQAKRLKFELQEYRDRVGHYPTDVSLKFELGKRLLQSGDIDEAIGMFQQATADARVRASAHLYLGSCFARKQWYDEAIDTLREGIEHHKADDDRLALELRYVLMDALEQRARREKDLAIAKESRQVASEILKADINFRDIKQRMDQIRQLNEELQGA